MNVDKAKKRIAKLVKKGFHGYPMITIEYFGTNETLATNVAISFIAEENAEPQVQKLASSDDVRHDETIQSTLIKIIDRADAATVTESSSVTLL